MNPEVSAFYHEDSGSISYVVAEPGGSRCAIVDPVMDFDPNSGRTGTGPADEIVAFVRARGLDVDWLLETHAHADHFSAAAYLKEKLGGRIATGATITKVQRLWKEIYNLPADYPADGSQFDRVLEGGERFRIGALEVLVIDTPGHTPANVTYVAGDAAFIGDTLLQPDFGTARCDFPGGSARELYHSIQRILALPPETRLFTGHDYMPGGRDAAWESTVTEQRTGNVHLQESPDVEQFVLMREARDGTLPMPRLILHALQVNINAGRLPLPEANGVAYLKIPLNRL
jgi:glyoxylase-like metal-dependent hydrolase (beta-lactamase superfamily II)